MGISVPVNNRHYKELKVISDSLGLGIKKTVEFLIDYYRKESRPQQSTIHVNPMQAHENSKNLTIIGGEELHHSLANLELDPRYEILPEIPSTLASRINPYLTEDKDISTPNTVIVTPVDAILEHETTSIFNQVEDVQKCGVCGMSRRKSAKFCYNCGNQL